MDMKQKKVLIVTLFGNYNYGNKFQNYAMQEVLKRYDLEVYTLNTQKIEQVRIEKKSYIKRVKNISIENILKKVKDSYNRNINNKRMSAFKSFSDKYIKLDECIEDNKLKEKFNWVCIGSDQVWKPGALEYRYAYAHFHNSNNVFSYAPSFGVSDIPEEANENVKSGLENMKSISVREQRGAEIIKKMIQKDVEVLVDPTMLLTTNEWDAILKKPRTLPQKEFVMTYFLGSYSRKRKKYVKQFAKKNNFEIVDLGQVDLKKYYCTDPAEFLYFLKNAKIIFTDSFHGCVFSILYKKPFYAMNREDNLQAMGSRIETLLDKFELKERFVEDCNCNVELNMDFKQIDSILEQERERSDKYLKNALGIKEN